MNEVPIAEVEKIHENVDLGIIICRKPMACKILFQHLSHAFSLVLTTNLKGWQYISICISILWLKRLLFKEVK